MSPPITHPTLWHAVTHAGFVVHAVIVILLGLSIASWTLILQRVKQLHNHMKQSLHFKNLLGPTTHLDSVKIPPHPTGMALVFQAGYQAFHQVRGQTHLSTDQCLEHSQTAMYMAQHTVMEPLEKHLPLLATIGATSPYIGLLGTVWGIMDAFQSLGGMKTASIAVVAPGISEALITTALGLFAAIPAVMAYNHCISQIDQLNHHYHQFQHRFLNTIRLATGP